MDSSSLVASVRPVGDPPSTAADINPAEKLRAAALSTLKRRKQAPAAATASLPTRPAALRGSASTSLDYGAAESSSSAQQQPQEPVPTTSAPGVVRTKSSEGGPPSREEGEISDSEMTIDDAGPSKPRLAKKRFIATSSATDRKAVAAPPVAVVAPGRQEQSLLDRIGDQVDVSTTSQARTRSPSPPDSALPVDTYIVDAEHVRPGLEITQEQYNTAKEIVLDILGWGVAPEYLVDCGISPITLFYVFHELNLRLPQNLDLSTIPIYDPKTRRYVPQRQRRSSIRQAASSKAEVPLASRISHPLPAKPTPTTSTQPPASPTTAKSSDVDLHNLEQERRRMLLLRRKNAQESKNNTSASSPTSSTPEQHSTEDPSKSAASKDEPTDKDVEMAPAVPAEVDEFLNSIGSSSSLPSAEPPRFPSVSSSMDIEMDSANEALPPPPSTGDSTTSFVTAPPLSAVSSSSDATVESRSDSINIRRSFSLETDSATSGDASFDSRRVTKRPVASDFADYEPTPRLTAHHYGANGHSSASAQPVRRVGSFAAVSAMRRCIIDLSDSEDEEEEGKPFAASSSSTVVTKPVPRPPILSRQAGTAATATVSGVAITPSALAEKEREINAMREMIARREAMRSRKMVSGRSTPNLSVDTSTASSSKPASPARQTQSPAATPPNTDIGMVNTNDPPKSASAPVFTERTSSQTPPIDEASSTPIRETNTSEQVDNTAMNVQTPEQTPIPAPAQKDTMTPMLHVDDGATSSSARVEDQQHQDGSTPITPSSQEQDSSFNAYQSLFNSYPFLRSGLPQQQQQQPQENTRATLPLPLRRSTLKSTSYPVPSSSSSGSSFTSIAIPPSHPSFSSSGSSSSSFSIDLRPLRLTALLKSLDPEKQICQYEVPGGGVCRDQTCEDVHLERAQPTDEDTISFLAKAFPQQGADRIREVYSTTAITTAQKGSNKSNGSSLEDRVGATLEALGVVVAV